MRILLTGVDGYIGIPLAAHLMRDGFDVTGLDTGFHRSGWLFHSPDERPRTITKDTRDLTAADVAGFDAIVHLADLSNDPVGELDPSVTFDINHRAAVRLAELARAASVRRFVYMSSCSVYGSSGDGASQETDPTQPLTAYAQCKLMVERDVGEMGTEEFAPTFLRNATAFGASPRQRFDLVVNDLAAMAYLDKRIRLVSDGSPWRPFVHILDIAEAVRCVLRAPSDEVTKQVLNVGSTAANYRVSDVAAIVASMVDGCEVEVGPPSADARNYKVDFTRITKVLPDFSCQWTVERGVAELLSIFSRIGFDHSMYAFRGYTRLKQIDYLKSSGQVDNLLHWASANRVT